jgi:DnaK suppressor protein
MFTSLLKRFGFPSGPFADQSLQSPPSQAGAGNALPKKTPSRAANLPSESQDLASQRRQSVKAKDKSSKKSVSQGKDQDKKAKTKDKDKEKSKSKGESLASSKNSVGAASELKVSKAQSPTSPAALKKSPKSAAAPAPVVPVKPPKAPAPPKAVQTPGTKAAPPAKLTKPVKPVKPVSTTKPAVKTSRKALLSPTAPTLTSMPTAIQATPKTSSAAATRAAPAVATTAQSVPSAAPSPAQLASLASAQRSASVAAALAPPPPLKPGRRSSAKAHAHMPPPAPMVPTHSPDAAKASYSAMTERAVAPGPHVAAKKDPKLADNWKAKSGEELTDEEVKAMPDAQYMNDKQMAFFRHKLSTLKQEIHNSASVTTEHLREDTVVVPDPTDRATIEEEHALELRTRDRERKLLKKIEQSIARIDSGDYGYCDETGEPIGVGRLIARPTASLSLEAQQRRELKQKMFGD